MTGALEALIRERIRARGPMPFDVFMSLALYHPEHGYYARGARVGWGGHYLTSPEIDPSFGRLWARAAEEIWVLCGRPPRFRVTEIGPGEGNFAAAFLASLGDGPFADALGYTLVEPLAPLRARQERVLAGRKVVWIDPLERLDPAPGVVFAHEVLDNVPVKLLLGTGSGTVELLVDERDGELALVPGPPVGIPLPPGHRRELAPERDAFVGGALLTIQSGALILIDYGFDDPPDTGWGSRPAGTLACYSAAGADDEPLSEVGSKDITAHVDWSAVREALGRAGAEPVGPLLQRDVLLALGARELDLRARDEHDDAIARGAGAEAIRALSRRQALATLTDPGGLGGLQVMVGLKGIDSPAFLQTYA